MTGTIKRFAVSLVVMVLSSGCVLQRQYNATEAYDQGMAEYYSGNYTSADQYFKWALDLKKEYGSAMVGRAQCQLQFAKENFASHNTGAALLNLEEALYWANLAVDGDPGNPRSTQVRVDILKLKGQIERGIKTAQWGVNVQGPNADSLLLMAKTYEDAGSYDEAEVAYKQAIAVAPGNVEVRVKAGRFYEKIGKRDLALIQYEEAWQLDPSNEDVQIKISELGGVPSEGQAQ